MSALFHSSVCTELLVWNGLGCDFAGDKLSGTWARIGND